MVCSIFVRWLASRPDLATLTAHDCSDRSWELVGQVCIVRAVFLCPVLDGRGGKWAATYRA